MEEQRHILLYDVDCSFCGWAVGKVLTWDRHDRVRAVPIQGAAGDRLLAEVPPEKRLDSWHLVTPDGAVLSGDSAAAEELARVLPGGRPLAALVHAFPGMTERA